MSAQTRIGSGAGFAGDRIEPAVQLAEHADLDDLVLECLAERTIALGQKRKLADPTQGHDPMLERRLRPLLPVAAKRGVRIVSNMGSANPAAAGRETCDLARSLGLDLSIAVVGGDDVLDLLDLSQPALESGRPLEAHGPIISANAYLGADSVLPALRAGADVVLTGRVADPSLFLAALVDRLDWDLADLPQAAAGTLVGHLLECAGQLTGGYFADPGRKDVPGLAELGFPFAEVCRDGSASFTKLAGTGGLVTRATVREQLLYEVTDPSGYLTPDVQLDMRQVDVVEEGPDLVRVSGARGRSRPDTLKVSVGYSAGVRGEAEISYAGPNAEARARLAGEVVTARLRDLGARIRCDLIGSVALNDPEHGEAAGPRECRLRVATIGDQAQAEAVCHEVEALYTNGPAGGGGVRTGLSDVIGIVSTLIPREMVTATMTLMEA